MKTLHNEFLGALLGAWLGIVTQFWKEPIGTMIPFTLGIGLIAIFIGLTTHTRDTHWRVIAGGILFLLIFIVGFAFYKVDRIKFLNSQQQIFFYVITFCWLGISLISSALHDYNRPDRK